MAARDKRPTQNCLPAANASLWYSVPAEETLALVAAELLVASKTGSRARRSLHDPRCGAGRAAHFITPPRKVWDHVWYARRGRVVTYMTRGTSR